MEQEGYILRYWGEIRGRAEPIRLLLAYLNQPYQMIHYEPKDFYKWFKQDKKELNHDFPNLPYLKDGDEVITETEAIMTYICVKAGKRMMVGITPDNQDENIVRFNAIRGVVEDFRHLIDGLAYAHDYEKQKEDSFSKIYAKMDYIDKYLGQVDFLFNGNICYIDFIMQEVLFVAQKMNTGILEQERFKNLKAYYERMGNLAGVSDYLKSDQNHTDWYCYGPYATWRK